MTIWLTSDPHLGHKLVAKIRGFNSVEEHDAAILGNIRRALRGDMEPEVWWLGDIAFDGWRDRIGAIGTIPGRHHLVLGNHDRAHPTMSRAHDYQSEYLTVFASVHEMARLSHEGQGFIASHYPYNSSTRNVDRNVQWRPRDCGKPLLHGDSHSSEQFSLSANGTPQLHVGLDAWGLKPVKLGDVAALLKDKMKGQPNG